MRIALVTRRYWPAVGGIERVASELGRALKALGHDVWVVAQRVDEGSSGWLTHTVREAPEFGPFEHDGLRVRQFRLPPSRRALLAPLGVEGIPRFPWLTRNWTRNMTGPWYGRVAGRELVPLLDGADVVHALGGAWVSVAAVEAARALSCPVVVTPFVHRGYWRDDPASVRSYRRADAVLATLEADAAELRALGLPADRIDVCRVPVPTAGDAARTPEPPPLILFVGARVQHKGIDLLRAAARVVWEAHPEARFGFLGPGPPLESLDRRELDLGALSDDERADWLERATLLALPSSTESFGIVVAEAWSVARPVVVSDIPVMAELVDSSGGGLSVPRDPAAIAAAIRELLGSPDRASGMGRAGHEFWRRAFDPEAVGRRHVELYEELARRRWA